MSVGSMAYPPDAEWLEPDGLGGFASGTVAGMRMRRYHALLLAATTPPTGRVVLVNGIEAWIETPAGRFALTTQRYAPDVLHPDGQSRITGFSNEPWPSWTFQAEDGTELTQEIACTQGRGEVVVRWRLVSGSGAVRLVVRPLLSGRDYHSLHRENADFGFEPVFGKTHATWRPYPGLPPVTVLHNGSYQHEPLWYCNFLYEQERQRGLDHVEDLASPGFFAFDLGAQDAFLILRAGEGEGDRLPLSPEIHGRGLLRAEATRRQRFASPLHRAADAYIVRRGGGRTILAGYPWFTDWGRDTFITLRGLLTVPGGIELARDILNAWAGTESRGMLPNRFPDSGEEPEYNSVDAALWFIIAVHDYLQAARRASVRVSDAEEHTLRRTIDRILTGYHQGSRYGVRVDTDGLLAAGKPGVQLTWMDVKIGDWVVTPRIGKPVEIQALWLNALAIGRAGSPDCAHLYRRARATFQARFWNAECSCLYDVVDADHVPGRNDASFRPNQIFAVGGLPYTLLDQPQATRVVEAVERELLTPTGLRSLARGEPGYRPHYKGGVLERDSAYHQGTVWPWLMGPFIEAWLRVRGSTQAAQAEARARFIVPLLTHLNRAGIGHLSEIADAEPPHTPRGCPFQAWSMGELLRALSLVEAGQLTAAS